MTMSTPGSITLGLAILAALVLPASGDGAASLEPSGAAPTQTRPTHVIELFTSQGCPACPPADRLLAELARRPDTIALSFAVDTWDYIGWKDTLASRSSTARQRAYATARGDRHVFTPQVIVDGVAAEVGADREAILRDTAVLPGRDGAMSVPLSIARAGATLTVTVGAAPTEGTASTNGTGSANGMTTNGSAKPVGIYALRVKRSATVAIGRGRNSGQDITYTNVVRAMTRIGDWDGHEARFSMPDLAGEDEGFVVLLQTDPPGRPGVILAAAKTGGL